MFSSGYPRREILSDAFKTLSGCPSKATAISSVKAVGDFIAYVYSDEFVQLNTTRFNVCLRSRTLLELPPTEANFYLHDKRSAFQARWIWATHCHKIESLG